jgi:hypothetical protein
LIGSGAVLAGGAALTVWDTSPSAKRKVRREFVMVFSLRI